MGNGTLWSHHYQIRRYEEPAKKSSLSLKIGLSIAISFIFQCYSSLVSVKGIVCPQNHIHQTCMTFFYEAQKKKDILVNVVQKKVGPHLLSLYALLSFIAFFINMYTPTPTSFFFFLLIKYENEFYLQNK